MSIGFQPKSCARYTSKKFKFLIPTVENKPTICLISAYPNYSQARCFFVNKTILTFISFGDQNLRTFTLVVLLDCWLNANSIMWLA